MLTNVNRGEGGGVKDMLTLAGDIRVRTGKNGPLNEIISLCNLLSEDF